MRLESIEYIKRIKKKHSKNFKEPIVEIGSFIVEGQETYADLRPLFPRKQYIGCDMREGNGVDKIENIHNLSFKSNSVGTIICIDTLEHVENIHFAMKEIYRVLKPGGIAIIVSVMNFPIHDYPSDYWRFTPEAFKSMLNRFDIVEVESDGEKDFPIGVYGYGIKNKRYSYLKDLISRIRNKLK